MARKVSDRGSLEKGRVDELKEYIDLHYHPSRDDLVCEYFLEPANGVSFERACQKIASEAGIGSWTDLATLDVKLFNELSPKVFFINKKRKLVKIAFSKMLFEPHNIPQIMSSVAGNVFGMSEVKSLRLLDIDFPDAFINSYLGPYYGIEGVRAIFGIKHRPFVGTVVKPKMGLNEVDHAKVAFNAWVGGCDFVKDDESLTNMSFNNFDKRVVETLRMRDRAERETGEHKAYLPNVTAPYSEMVRRTKHVVRNGGEFVMVNAVAVGWAALQELRDQDLKVVFHAHRAMHATFTRNQKSGISMLVIAKLCRLIGIDQIHVGGVVGKMLSSDEDARIVGEAIEHQIVTEKIYEHCLQQDWHNLRPMLAVCSGGLHPGKVSRIIHQMGREILIQAGGGIHGHPLGTRAGACAMRQAVDAEMSGISAHEYAKTHSELAAALKKWKD